MYYRNVYLHEDYMYVFFIVLIVGSLTDRQIVRNLARPGYLVQYSEIDDHLKSVRPFVHTVLVHVINVPLCVCVADI